MDVSIVAKLKMISLILEKSSNISEISEIETEDGKVAFFSNKYGIINLHYLSKKKLIKLI